MSKPPPEIDASAGSNEEKTAESVPKSSTHHRTRAEVSAEERRAAFMSVAGGWAGLVNGDALIEQIYADRGIGSAQESMLSLDANKALIRAFFERVWNQGDEAAIDEYIAEHAAGNDPDFGAGREAFRTQWRMWRHAFPDLHFAVEELVAEGETVVCRWTLTGTHRGPFAGVPATGRAVRVGGMSLDHLRDGQLVSGFDGWDALGLRRQIGALPEETA